MSKHITMEFALFNYRFIKVQPFVRQGADLTAFGYPLFLNKDFIINFHYDSDIKLHYFNISEQGAHVRGRIIGGIK
jgi:hypothetical protein